MDESSKAFLKSHIRLRSIEDLLHLSLTSARLQSGTNLPARPLPSDPGLRIQNGKDTQQHHWRFVPRLGDRFNVRGRKFLLTSGRDR